MNSLLRLFVFLLFPLFRVEVVHEYEDRGVCGQKARRPGLDALMADARRKKFSVLMVAAFDRIARSTKNFLQIVDELDSLGIAIFSKLWRLMGNVDLGFQGADRSQLARAESPASDRIAFALSLLETGLRMLPSREKPGR